MENNEKQNIQPALRILIRNQLKALIYQTKANELIFKSPVVDVSKFYFSRPKPIIFQELPVGTCYFSEELEELKKGNAEYINTLAVDFVFISEWSVSGEYEDWLDSRDYEIKKLFGKRENRFLGLSDKIVEKTMFSSITPLSLDGEKGKVYASNKTRLLVKYKDSFEFDQGNIGEFLRLYGNYETTSGAKASDEINIRS